MFISSGTVVISILDFHLSPSSVIYTFCFTFTFCMTMEGDDLKSQKIDNTLKTKTTVIMKKKRKWLFI